MPEKTGKKITTKKVVLHFPKRMVDEPILFHLIKDFDLEFNILKASITPEAEGLMVVELKGEQTQYDHGVQYLLDRGVKIQALSRDVTRNEERCTSCGACVKTCPRHLIALVPKSGMVHVECMNKDRGPEAKNVCDKACIACMICQKNCPSEAIKVENFKAVIDYSKCTNCGICVEKCPRKCIRLEEK